MLHITPYYKFATAIGVLCSVEDVACLPGQMHGTSMYVHTIFLYIAIMYQMSTIFRKELLTQCYTRSGASQSYTSTCVLPFNSLLVIK
jgi:hypothetical protein